MKKAICVNAGLLISKDGSIANGECLIKGEVYTITGEGVSVWGDKCYFIAETGDMKQCVRFKKLTKKEKKAIKTVSRIFSEL